MKSGITPMKFDDDPIYVFIVIEWQGCAFNQVEVSGLADGKPGVPAVVKGFGDGIKADEVAVKFGTCFQILNVKGNVVYNGFLGLR